MTTIQKFKNIWKLEMELKRLISTHVADTAEGSELYYSKQAILKKLLVEFLREDFTTLNGLQMLRLCSMIGSHRPVEPHSFLTTCSIRLEKVKPIQATNN